MVLEDQNYGEQRVGDLPNPIIASIKLWFGEEFTDGFYFITRIVVGRPSSLLCSPFLCWCRMRCSSFLLQRYSQVSH